MVAATAPGKSKAAPFEERTATVTAWAVTLPEVLWTRADAVTDCPGWTVVGTVSESTTTGGAAAWAGGAAPRARVANRASRAARSGTYPVRTARTVSSSSVTCRLFDTVSAIV